MTISSAQKSSSTKYKSETIRRADRALSCSPFLLNLFATMRNQSVFLQDIAAEVGVQQGYTNKPLAEAWVESNLLWLIKVGLLRREVDGQGITDSFRLTPLGRQLVEKWSNIGGSLPQPSWWERFLNSLRRWLSF